MKCNSISVPEIRFRMSHIAYAAPRSPTFLAFHRIFSSLLFASHSLFFPISPFSLLFQVDQSNGPRYFPLFREPEEPLPLHSQTLSPNAFNSGFPLRGKVAPMEVLRRRYLKPRKRLRISRGLITRFPTVTFWMYVYA